MAKVDTAAPPAMKPSGHVPPHRRGPDDGWRGRHGAILLVAWIHVFLTPLFGLTRNLDLRQVLYESAPIAGFALIGTIPAIPRRGRAAAVTMSLLAASAVLVHFSRGLAEMHFHFFVVVALIALYQDLIPFGLAIAFALAHHGVIGRIAPDLVYDRPLGEPFSRAVVRAVFVFAISVVCLAGWRLNRRVLMRQQRAEGELLEEKRTVETLHAVGTGVVSELDLDRVAQLVTDEAVKALGAEFGAFFYNIEDSAGDSYMLYTLSGASPADFDRFPIPRNTQIFGPTLSGSAIVRIDDVLVDQRYGHNEPYNGLPPGHLPVRSYLAVPVTSRGSSEVLGGLFFGHQLPGVFTERDEQLASGIATQAAIAFDNARLYKAERDAFQMAERARSRLSLLAEAGRMLVASLDPETTLRSIARVTVPTFADMCIIDLCEDNMIRRVDAVGAPGIADRFVDEVRDYPPDPHNEDHGVVRVVNGGPAELNEGPAPDVIERATRSRAHADAVRRMNVTSSIVVPLMGRESVLGAVTFHTVGASGRKLTAEDLAIAEEIGRRGGMAIENARLYNEQRTVAESLQIALLPQQLPEIPGFASAARYLPAGRGERVGGDWYDLFEIPTGEIAIVMGDVVGHGIPAASLMAQLRNALRAYVWDGIRPGSVMSRLNQLLYGLEREGMATASLAILDPVKNVIRLANAGHPPLLRSAAEGAAEFIGEGLGPPLGAAPYMRYAEREIELHPNDVLVFYTDGLVEDRAMPLDAGLAKLRDAVASSTASIEDLADNVLRGCLGTRTADDDVAVLVLRALPLATNMKLQLAASPAVLGSFRQTLRRWLHGHRIREDDAQAVLIAACEACNNAIEHGSPDRGSQFDVEVDLGDDLEIIVRSQGGWRAPRSDGGGRGLPVMEGLMDEVHIAGGADGIEVKMRRHVHRGGATS